MATTVTIESIQSGLLDFILGRVRLDVDVTVETDLLDGGILDSLMVMDLVTQVEAAYGVVLRDGDIAPRHLRTVARLATLIASRTGGRETPRPHFVRTLQPQQG